MTFTLFPIWHVANCSTVRTRGDRSKWQNTHGSELVGDTENIFCCSSTQNRLDPFAPNRWFGVHAPCRREKQSAHWSVFTGCVLRCICALLNGRCVIAGDAPPKEHGRNVRYMDQPASEPGPEVQLNVEFRPATHVSAKAGECLCAREAFTLLFLDTGCTQTIGPPKKVPQ